VPDHSTIRERLALPASVELHRRIRRLWQRHSIAEGRRDIDGLIETLAPDCVYELVATGQRWEGHAGAREFYVTLFAAFPDNRFDLTDIVIGPQGVMEVATLTATHRAPFAGLQPTGRSVRLTVVIHFPWDPEAELFSGERIYLDRGELGENAAASI
jgi:predicted ester cyclase